MYNLLVSAAQGFWDAAECILDADRYLEFTKPEVAKRFKDLDDKEVRAQLTSIPTLFAYETPRNADAKAGWIQSIQVRSRHIRIVRAFDPAIKPISPGELVPMVWDLGIEAYELGRTHWSIKKVDLLDVLSRRGVPGQVSEVPPYRMAKSLYISSKPSERQIAFAPHVFQVPEGSVEDDLVALMMPFSKEFDPVRDAIARVCQASGLRCVRADNVWEESAIIQDIFNLIFRSQIVVVDFTGRNPNVMYETGIAHTLGKHVIPIVQSLDDVPFDMRHHRVLRYLSNAEGIGVLERELKAKLTSQGSRATSSAPKTPIVM